jgi:hypothetical protein
VHELEAPPSSVHRKIEPVSLELKEKLADAEFDNDGGCDVIEVSGGAVSTVHVQVAGVRSGPAALTALTEKVCVPSATAPSVSGEEHAEYDAASSLHWNVAVGSVEVNENVGEELFDGSGGCAVIEVSGGGAFWIWTVCVAELPVLPAASVARAPTTYVPSAGIAVHVNE